MDTPTPQSYSDILGQVYVLCDPTTGAVRYVGKTCRGIKQRLLAHMKNARAGVRRHVYNWIRSLGGQTPLIEIVEDVRGDLDETERFWISQFRALGFDLTNATDGGEGAPGHIASAATRAKLSATGRGRKLPPRSESHRCNHAAARRGKLHTAATKVRMARAHGGRPIVDLTTGIRYETNAEAALALGVRRSQVRKALANQHRLHGHVFKFAEAAQ